MDFISAMNLAEKYKIAVPRWEMVKGGEQARGKEAALKAARKLGYPVALKLISKKFLHKSDKGVLKLNLNNDDELAKAHVELLRNAKGASADGLLVQKMAKPGVELLVGGKTDPQFGPTIVFGLGGIFVEVFRDVSVRVCPITRDDAFDMIHELRGYPLLAGARGRKPVDEKSLIELLLNVSQLLCDHEGKINEFDLNPVIAYEKGCLAVDVRIL